MNRNLQKQARQVVFAVCTASLCLGAGLPQAFAQDRNQQNGNYQNQNGQQDWTNNPKYQMGQQAGQQDRTNNRQRHHWHPFWNHNNKQAYAAGYQNSWNGQGGQNRNGNGNDNQNGH